MLDIRRTSEVFLLLVQRLSKVWVEAKDFASLEDGVRWAVQEAGGQLLVMFLEGLDDELYRDRPKGLKAVGFKVCVKL